MTQKGSFVIRASFHGFPEWLLVSIVATYPVHSLLLVAAFRHEVEHGVGAHHHLNAAPVGGVGAKDLARVLEEGANAGPFLAGLPPWAFPVAANIVISGPRSNSAFPTVAIRKRYFGRRPDGSYKCDVISMGAVCRMAVHRAASEIAVIS